MLGQVPNPGINTCRSLNFNVTQNCSLNKLVRNFLVSINEAICHTGSLVSPKEAEIICHIDRSLPLPPKYVTYACNAGDLSSIPGLERSPGERKGYPLQYSGLENSMDCIGHGGRKELDRTTGLFTFTFMPKVIFSSVHGFHVLRLKTVPLL